MRHKIYISAFLLITSLLWISSAASAQTRQELEQKRKALQQEINTTQKLLDQTDESKQAALSTLETLRKQLESRRALLSNYKKDIEQSEERIEQMEDSIGLLENKLRAQTQAYSETLRKMYLWKQQQPLWLYYVSSTSANELFRKWIYLNQIEDWQEARRRQIKETKEHILEKRSKAQEEQKALTRKLKQEEANAKALDQDLGKEQQLLTQLKSKEGELRSKLQRQIKERKKLENAIARVIEEARKKEKREKKTAFSETPAGKAVSGAFAKNKGRLPWPVDKGVVTRQFGKQKHPTLSNLYIQNNGVDIATEKDAIVKSLFKGEVLGIVEVPGYQKMVIIQHGEYYSVYSRLAEVSVTKGDQVQMDSHIGQAYTNPEDGNTLVHLEVWQDKTKLNPLDWLVGR